MIDDDTYMRDICGMPHLHLEYSRNVQPDGDLKSFLVKLHETLGEFESIQIRDLKSRVTSYDIFNCGINAPDNGFVHIRLELLSGRPLTLRQVISSRLFALLENEFRNASQSLKLDISVEIREMDRDTYRKRNHP